MATTVARLEAILTADTGQYTRKMREAEGQTNRMGGVMGKAKLAAAGFAVGGVALVAEGLKKSVEVALEAQKSQARLEVAFKTAHLSATKYHAQIEQLESSSRKLGFTDEDVKNSLGSLIVATHNVKDATRDVGVAQDIARFKGIGLEQATKMLTMAQAGSQRATKQLGLSVQASTVQQDKAKAAYNAAKDALDKHYGALKTGTAAEQEHYSVLKNNIDTIYKGNEAVAKMTDKQVTAAKVVDLVSQKLHGQSDAYSKTASGAMEQFHAQLQHIEVTIGTTLIPAMTKMIAALNSVLVWLQENWPKISGIVSGVLTGLVAVIKTTTKPVIDAFKIAIALMKGDWSGAWDAMKQFVIDSTLPFVKVAKYLGEQVKKATVAALKGIGAEAWAVINDIGEVIKANLTTIISWGVSVANHIKNAVTDTLVGIGNAAWGVINNIGDAIANQAATIAGWGVNVGGWIKQGLVAALAGGLKAVKDAVEGLFGKVIHWAEHALGINSPSTVFHGIGQNVVRGFINGVGSMAGVLKNAVVGMATGALSHLNPFGGGTQLAPGQRQQGGTAGEQGGFHASTTQAQQFASMALGKFGWGHDQFASLLQLWNGESGWRWNAKNSSSGAYGIPQSLPASKMGSAGPNWKDNAFTQIMWGLNYIKGRYGSPSAAYSAWSSRSPHWYAGGGLVPGSGLRDSVPAMLTPGEMILNRSQQNLLGGPGALARTFGFGPPRSGAFAGGGIAGGGTIVVPLNIDGNELARVMIDPIRRQAQVFSRRNGRRAV